jgi:hypothetical protein
MGSIDRGVASGDVKKFIACSPGVGLANITPRKA